MRKRTTFLLAAIGAAAAIALALQRPPEKAADGLRYIRGDEPIPARLPTALPERGSIGKPFGAPFATLAVAKPAAPVAPPQASYAPAVPPIPYKFVGHVSQGTEVEYILAKGDLVFPVKRGHTLEGVYRVDAVATEEITLLYLPLGITTRLSLASPVDEGVRRAQPSAGAVNIAAPGFIPLPSAVSQQSAAMQGDAAPGPVLSQAPDSPRTAATGTRAAHLRRERSQQLPPIGAITP